jgi:hypothetical protein
MVFSSKTLLLQGLGLLLASIAVSVLGESVLQEYCDDKSFVPTCSASDEVIIMEQATYGRMRLGKCVPEKFAEYVGCSANVLSFVEMKCSGRRSCSGILKELFASDLCESVGVKNFLDASYSCIKGLLVNIFNDNNSAHCFYYFIRSID